MGVRSPKRDYEAGGVAQQGESFAEKVLSVHNISMSKVVSSGISDNFSGSGSNEMNFSTIAQKQDKQYNKLNSSKMNIAAYQEASQTNLATILEKPTRQKSTSLRQSKINKKKHIKEGWRRPELP